MSHQDVMRDIARHELSRARYHEDAAAACARLMGSARDAAASAAIFERMRKHREEAKRHAMAAVWAERNPAQTA
jgi:hypothetical protein